MTFMNPAQSLANEFQYLTKGDHTPVQAVEAPDAGTLRLTIADAWSGGDDPDMNRLVADHAASLINDTIDGVQLVVQNADGYVGREGDFPGGDEQFFATSIPGVTGQALHLKYDVDGDGTIADGERAFVIPVESAERAASLDRLLVDTYGDDPLVIEAPAGE